MRIGYCNVTNYYKKKMKIPKAADYLDEVIQTSLTSNRKLIYDADIAATTGLTRQTLSHYRAGRNMSVIAAVRIAKLLGIHQMEAVAATMYHQAKSDEERQLWEETFKEYKEKGKR